MRSDVETAVIDQASQPWLAAWKVPYWGVPADDPMPSWLVRELQSGTIFVNHLGGLSRSTLMEDFVCYPGEFAVLMQNNTIEFREFVDVTDAERLSA